MPPAKGFSQADIKRIVRGAMQATEGTGRSPRIEIEGERVVITLVDETTSEESERADLARRMREAFRR